MKTNASRRTMMWTLVAVIVLGGILAAAQLSTTDRAAVERYRAAIASAESGSSTRAIEGAFSALGSLHDALMGVRDGTTIIASLSEDDFGRLHDELRGVVLNREEVLLVEPDIDYFSKLAGARGEEVDRAFFGALKKTYPNSVWPIYVDQQTDVTGCTRFGSMTLVETYRTWSAFQRAYRNRYVAGAAKETEAVLKHLTESTCACGDMTGVRRELEGFRQRFPTSSARASIEKRLQAARAGRSDIRASCKSG